MAAIVFKYRNISLSIDSNLFPYARLNFVPGKKSKEKKENKGLGKKVNGSLQRELFLEI